MHDIDRTQSESEYEPEMDALEADSFEFTEEAELSGGTEAESPFTEEQEMEMAAELLEITDEAELDQFLGKLLSRAWGGIKKFARSSIGRKLGGLLKGVAKKALPILGSAAGGFFGGPAGAAIGSKLATGAGGLFGLELEGMSAEDQEFEVARRVVRLAGAAANRAVSIPPTGEPLSAARAALTEAARRYAPGLLRGAATPPPPAVGVSSRSGRWIRRGSKIILLGA